MPSGSASDSIEFNRSICCRIFLPLIFPGGWGCQASREGYSLSETSRRSSAALCPSSSCTVSAEKTVLSASVDVSTRVRSMTSTESPRV
uniref:Uncharacterized protein n=1 Tax=Escherichia coli TaxID=562 RepID=A0A0E3KBK6_ECOLX|nr:hypothetical protein [Escherichia coli]